MTEPQSQPTGRLSAEEVENWRKRLGFRAWHRGTREMDLLMGSFADRHLSQFDRDQLAAFEAILTENDPDVYDWITGHRPLPDMLRSSVMDLLLAHRFAT